MNQDFAVSNTTTDVTHVGPLAQEIALDKNGTISLDQSIVAPGGDQPLTIAAIKQAALGTSIVLRADPAGANVANLTLDLPAGGVAGDVASALVSQLGLLRQNDGVTINFALFTSTPADINLTSTDPNILGLPQALFSVGAAGLALVAIELAVVGTSATPPVVRITSGNITFA
jgi:hypothetical protein